MIDTVQLNKPSTSMICLSNEKFALIFCRVSYALFNNTTIGVKCPKILTE